LSGKSEKLKLKDFGFKTTAFPWLALGFVYLAINFLVTGTARFEFMYGLLYAISFICIALVLGAKKPGLLSGLVVATVGTLTVFVQMITFNMMFAVGLAVVALIVLLADIFGAIKWKSTQGVQYLTFVPFFLTFAWTAYYFYGRFTGGLPLPPATILNHAGIALLSLDSILRVAGAHKKVWLSYIALIAIVFGALWLTAGLGWGLQLNSIF